MKRLMFCLFGACAWHLTVSAHVLDQYLQVTQIALAPGGVRVELRLIPGKQVADRICALIDADGDGQITTAEAQAYERRVWQDIGLEINGVNAPLTLAEMQFPTPPEMQEGLGTIRLTYTAAVTLSSANQQLLYFYNNHVSELGVYLVNTLMPTTNEIQLGKQDRDALQHRLRLNFYVTRNGAQSSSRWIGGVLLFLCIALIILQSKYARLEKVNGRVIDGSQ